MIRASLTALLLLPLTLCIPPQDTPQTFRDTDQPIASIALFDPGKISGTWAEVAHFAPKGTPCGFCLITVTQRPGAALDLQATGQGSTLLLPAGPGRLAAADGTEWWVLWVDADYRTLVIGTPNGRFGHIFDRSPRPSPDRLKAAQSVLARAGYDLRQLRRTAP